MVRPRSASTRSGSRSKSRSSSRQEPYLGPKKTGWDDRDPPPAPPPPPPRHSGPMRLIVLPSVLVVMLLLFTQGWFSLADSVIDGWTRWAASQKATGWTIVSGTPERHGYPLTIRIQLPNLRATGPAGGLEATSASLTFKAWAPTTAELRISGPLTLITSDGQKLTGTVETAIGTLRQTDTGPDATLTIQNFRGKHAVSGAPVSLETLTFALTPLSRPQSVNERTPVYRVGLSAKALVLPPQITGALGTTTRNAVLEAEMRGPFTPPGQIAPPPDTALRGQLMTTLSDSLRAWRDAGGTLEVQRLFIDWPPVTLGAAGTLSLDSALQPEGAFSTSITGLMPMLDRLEQQAVIRGRDASLARVIVGAMGQRAADGSLIHAIPMGLQNRRLSLGPVALLTLPDILWDSHPDRPPLLTD